jgi:hypothetical protein
MKIRISMLPVFPSLAAFVATIAGYQVPVVCQPLTAGTVVQATVTSTAPDYEPLNGPVSWPPTTGDESGVAFFLVVPPGASVTVSIAGQTVSLPSTPPDTPATDEDPPTGGETGWVDIPAVIVFDQSTCDGWTGSDATARGQALLLAVYEAMEVRWADSNEALTECRAMQAVPTQLDSLFPALTDPGPVPVAPGAAPVKPRLTTHTTRARWKQQLARWSKAYSTWRTRKAHWAQAYAQWQAVEGPWLAQQNDEKQITAAVQADDAALPAEFHGATC